MWCFLHLSIIGCWCLLHLSMAAPLYEDTARVYGRTQWRLSRAPPLLARDLPGKRDGESDGKRDGKRRRKAAGRVRRKRTQGNHECPCVRLIVRYSSKIITHSSTDINVCTSSPPAKSVPPCRRQTTTSHCSSTRSRVVMSWARAWRRPGWCIQIDGQ